MVEKLYICAGPGWDVVGLDWPVYFINAIVWEQVTLCGTKEAALKSQYLQTALLHVPVASQGCMVFCLAAEVRQCRITTELLAAVPGPHPCCRTLCSSWPLASGALAACTYPGCRSQAASPALSSCPVLRWAGWLQIAKDEPGLTVEIP